MDLEKLLIEYAPSNRPCGIRNRQIINEIESRTGLNEYELREALNRLPYVSTKSGSNGIASIEIDEGFPIN